MERPKQKDHKGIACGGQQRPCRHIHWVSPVRHLWELTACLDSLSFLQRQAPHRAPLVPHRSVSLAHSPVREKGILNSASEPLGPTAIRLPHRLSYCAERRRTFHCPSLCSFWCNVFRQKRVQLFVCVRTVRMDVSAYVCVPVCVRVLTVMGSTFFLFLFF